MKRYSIPFLLVLVLLLSSWGIWGHEHINRAAVFALPSEMRTFYYNHIDFITVESTGPDMKRSVYSDKSEGPKHYIDIEGFDRPLDSLPRTSAEKSKVYADSTLQKFGSLPWQIQDMMAKLTKAFKDNRRSEILLLSADLAHYLGDANMPLHTSLNYDGKLTNQPGVHSFWESRLPEVFGKSYNLHTREAMYIDDVTKETWRIIKNSHQLVDTLLAIDRRVRASIPEEKLYKKDEQGNLLKTKYNTPIQSNIYAEAFHTALHGMVEEQMKTSITTVADFWYTAWVNGGKPDLSKLDDPELTEQNKPALTRDFEWWKKGRITKLKTDLEY
jgi:hypothetical protein